MVTLACAAFITVMFTICIGVLLFRDACKHRDPERKPGWALAMMAAGVLLMAPAAQWEEDAHAMARQRDAAREQAMMEFVFKTAMRCAIEFEAKRRELGYK